MGFSSGKHIEGVRKGDAAIVRKEEKVIIFFRQTSGIVWTSGASEKKV